MSRDLLTDLLAYETRVWDALVAGDAAADEALMDEGFLGVPFRVLAVEVRATALRNQPRARLPLGLGVVLVLDEVMWRLLARCDIDHGAPLDIVLNREFFLRRGRGRRRLGALLLPAPFVPSAAVTLQSTHGGGLEKYAPAEKTVPEVFD